MGTKEDVDRLHRESTDEAPPIAILECIGQWPGRRYAPGHKPFVIKHRSPNFPRPVWIDEIVAEYDTLDQALLHPGAQPYGSTATCRACRNLPVDFTAP